MKSGTCGICQLIAVLAGFGALNWGLIGIFQFNAVEVAFGDMTGAARTVYTLLGLAGLALLVSMIKCCPCRKAPSSRSSEGGEAKHEQ